jgi:hypothetical protein
VEEWDDLEDDLEEPRPARRLRWQTVAAIVLSGIGGALEQLAAIPEAVACLLVADANHQDNRVAFHEEAALEIETLTQED